MLGLTLCSLIYLGLLRHLLSLHLRIAKPGKDYLPLAASHVGDGFPNSLCPENK